MRLNILAAVIVAAFVLVPAVAQEQQARVPVYVEASGDDLVGRDLAYQVRETIRLSAGLTLADRESDARFILRVVTLDPDSKDSAGLSTVYSAVYTMRTFHDFPVEMYKTSVVGTCGRNRVNSCARSITATLDEQAIDLRRMIRNVLESQSGS